MSRRMWYSVCYALGLATLVFLFMSLIYPEIGIRELYATVCIVAPICVFCFYTFELRLFSKSLWIRRAITICFSVITILIVNILFGYIRWNDKKDWSVYGICVAFVVIVSTLIYYVADKIEKRNLAAINQKLTSENLEANSK